MIPHEHHEDSHVKSHCKHCKCEDCEPCNDIINAVHKAGHDHYHLLWCQCECHDSKYHGEVTWKLLTMLALTGLFFFAELITGFITKSLSLQSDAFHMFSDEASLLVGFIAHHLKKRPPSSKMSFGWARAEVVGGLANATFMLGICLTLFCESIERIISPEEIQEPEIFLIVGFLGFLVNIIGIFIFHNHDHSDNLQGIFLHLFGDLLGSVAVIISAIVVKWTDWKYKSLLDPVISLVIVFILALGAFKLFWKTAQTVCECTPSYIDIDNIKKEILDIENVSTIHEIHIWELGRKKVVANLNVGVVSPEEILQTKNKCRSILTQHGVFSSTIETSFEIAKTK